MGTGWHGQNAVIVFVKIKQQDNPNTDMSSGLAGVFSKVRLGDGLFLLIWPKLDLIMSMGRTFTSPECTTILQDKILLHTARYCNVLQGTTPYTVYRIPKPYTSTYTVYRILVLHMRSRGGK